MFFVLETLDGELAIVFCTSFWWRKVDGGEFRYQKSFSAQKNPGVLPHSNHPFSGALAFWIFSFRKFLWPFWYLFVRSVYHSQKESFLCFCLVFERIFFLKKNTYGASINWWESFPPNLTFEVSPIVTPRLWNNTPNWNTPLNGNLYHPGQFLGIPFNSWRCRGIAERQLRYQGCGT